jgi:fructokinase
MTAGPPPRSTASSARSRCSCRSRAERNHGQVLHACSPATFLEPGAAHVQSVLRFSSDRCLITYDPNIRRDIIGDQSRARRTFEDNSRLATLVKLSDEDAAWLYPGLETADAARGIPALGVKVVAVTDGMGAEPAGGSAGGVFRPVPRQAFW